MQLDYHCGKIYNSYREEVRLMDYNFLWTTPSAGAPIVSIATYGISFNSIVVDLLNRPPKVLLGFDEKNMVIGVKPVIGEVEEPRAYRFAEPGRQGVIRIGNKDFLKYVSNKSGIDFRKIKKYLASWDEDSKTLIIDLRNASLESLAWGEEEWKI